MDRKPWASPTQTRLTADDFMAAAASLACDQAALRAVWAVESGGRPFRGDGTLERRFEPHKMPSSKMNWRDSLAISAVKREVMFADAYARQPDAALQATSWGGPQIMGFNFDDCGFTSPRAMVEAMARSEGEQLIAFVNLCVAWKLDRALRAKDWLAFATRWNGNGQPQVYANKIESAFRKASGGRPSPEVLRVGDRGPAVTRLQDALGVAADGAFGPGTLQAVVEFQAARGLPADGVVGAITWKALSARMKTAPMAKLTSGEVLSGTVEKATASSGAVLATIEGARRALPDDLFTYAIYAVVGLAFVAGAVMLIKRLTR